MPCGRRNIHASLPAGSTAGENENCGVPDSATVSDIAIATGVAAEPITMSTLSSLMKRLALTTPLVGSVASSSTMTLSFSPAMLVGHSLM